MNLFVSKVLSSVLQIIVFSLVPFVWWLVTARKKESFGKWIGLYKVEKSLVGDVLKFAAVTGVIFLGVSAYILYALKGMEGMATSEFNGMGISALPVVLVYAVLNTSLPEEILFRGFLLKRLAAKTGFGVANFIQCVIFGMMHGLMFVKVAGLFQGILIIVFTEAVAWLMGYTNEKKAGGSILPSWCIHAAANIFSGMAAAFLLF